MSFILFPISSISLYYLKAPKEFFFFFLEVSGKKTREMVSNISA